MGESGLINPRFLDLSTSWRSVVSFTPLPIYPTGTRTPIPVMSGQWAVAIPTMLPRLKHTPHLTGGWAGHYAEFYLFGYNTV
jgi:hypothetical protein